MATNGQGTMFIAQGAGAQLIVMPTHVIIRRTVGPSSGDIVIQMGQIAAVHLKRPGGFGAFTPGFIRLVLVGEQEPKGRGGWAWNAASDEHVILMTLRRYKDFVHAKELIEQYQAALGAPPTAGG